MDRGREWPIHQNLRKVKVFYCYLTWNSSCISGCYNYRNGYIIYLLIILSSLGVWKLRQPLNPKRRWSSPYEERPLWWTQCLGEGYSTRLSNGRCPHWPQQSGASRDQGPLLDTSANAANLLLIPAHHKMVGIYKRSEGFFHVKDGFNSQARIRLELI